MRRRKKAGVIGRFDALEDRIVMASRPALVNADIQAFFANYAATVPALVQTWDTLHATAVQTQAPSDIAAAKAANANIRNTITLDVNELAYSLWNSLGSSSFNTIRLSVTGVSTPTYNIFSTGTANDGSLLQSFLAVDTANPAALGGQSGLNYAADVSIAAAYAVSVGHPILPLAPFGNFSATFFTDVYPLATKLHADRVASSVPPTAEQQAVIDADIANIDAVTIRDTNALATTLSHQLGKAYNPSIALVITGTSTPNSVLYTPGGATPAYGSLLATLLSLDGDGLALADPNVTTAIVTQFAFI